MAYPFGAKAFGLPQSDRRKLIPSLSWKSGKTQHRFFSKFRRSSKKAQPVTVSAIKLEAMEPRYLLSADLMPLSVEMGGLDGASYTLEFDDTSQVFRVFDDESGQIVDQRALSETSEVVIKRGSRWITWHRLRDIQ